MAGIAYSFVALGILPIPGIGAFFCIAAGFRRIDVDPFFQVTAVQVPFGLSGIGLPPVLILIPPDL